MDGDQREGGLMSHASVTLMLRRVLRGIVRHPVACVVVVALLARLIVALGSYALTDGYLIPDEHLYVDLGRAVVHGQSPEQWYPGYGQSFYDSLGAFTAPLVLLFRIFGPERVVGQVFAAVVGAAAAGVTVAIGLRFLRPAFAVLAGLVVALTPSEVVFSSVVLREAHVWLALTVVALGAILLAGTEWRRLAGGAVLAAAGLLALGFLRDQTLLAACWALPLALLFTPRARWLPRMAAAVALAAAMPWVGGTGIGGAQLVRGNAPILAKTRATLAVGANSAFGGATPPPAAPSAPSAPAAKPAGPSLATQAAVAASTEDQSVRQGLGHLPTGLIDVTLRPLPWQSTVGLTLLMARLETLGWYVLYGLTLVGIVVSLRRRPARLALQFPVLVMGMLVGIAALTQGNLGTAFRHRDQILWVLALCAAAGLQWLASDSRWARRRTRVDATVARPPAEQSARAPVAVLTAPGKSNQ